MSENIENEKINSCKFCDDTIECGKKHIGKVGVALGILGVTSSVLVGIHLIVAGAVVLGLTNIGIVFGGVMYDRLQLEANKINDENMSLKTENMRLTSFQAFPSSQTITKQETTSPFNSQNDTQKNIDSFDSIYHGSTYPNLAHNMNVIRSTTPPSAFSDNTR